MMERWKARWLGTYSDPIGGVRKGYGGMELDRVRKFHIGLKIHALYKLKYSFIFNILKIIW